MSGFKIWDKVVYNERYLDTWKSAAAGMDYPHKDIYTIKKQLTRTSYLADWEKPENRGRIVNYYFIEKYIIPELLDKVTKNGDNK